MKGFSINFTELLFLCESCYPPRNNMLRSGFFDKLVSIYYHELSGSERSRLLKFVRSRRKYDPYNDQIRHLESRYELANSFFIILKGDKSQHRYNCYKHECDFWFDNKDAIDIKLIDLVTLNKGE